MSSITKKLKVGNEEGQIFICSLHTNGLELEDEFRLFGKFLSCKARWNGHLLDLMKKCARYEELKIRCLHARYVRVWNEHV